MLKIFGTATLADVLDDLVVYRGLVPLDRRLPDLGRLRGALGLGPGALPRKTEPDYARVVAEMLRAARALDHDDRPIGSLVMVGDTEHNDGTAFANLCRVLEVPGAAFICDEDDAPPLLAPRPGGGPPLYRANRWRLLADFDARLATHGVAVGERTVVVLDIDKTALGARGRNHAAIDAARFAAVRTTAAEALGAEVELGAATAAYHRLNRPEFHAFTTDNQDYLAYLSLLVGAGWIGLDELADGARRGRWTGFAGLLGEVGGAAETLPAGLAAVHAQVAAAVAAGDPTPFKRFRAAEYVETVTRMGGGGASGPVDDIAAERITLTREVLLAAAAWRRRGTVVFGLSDKPDEASVPPPELAAAGWRPLHRTQALVLGESE